MRLIIDQNDFPTGLEPIGELKVQENQAVGTGVGQFQATDEDGDSLTFGCGPEIPGMSFTLSDDGVLATARVDFEQAEAVTVRVAQWMEMAARIGKLEVIIQDQFENEPPRDLSQPVCQAAENRDTGTVVTSLLHLIQMGMNESRLGKWRGRCGQWIVCSV